MEETSFEQVAVPSLRAVFNGARSFGLTEGEIWRAADATLDEVGGGATVAEYLDELNGVLASAILAKQRHVLAEEQGNKGPENRPRKRRILSRHRP